MLASHLERVICGVIWYTMSGLSLFCSVMTPIIIYKMRIWNGTLLLVISLSLTLAVYSFGLVLTAVNTNPFVCQMQGVLIFYSGMSSALWTTCFSTTLLLLVTGVKFGGINEIYKYFCSVAIGIPLILTSIGLGYRFVTRGYLSCFVSSDQIDFQGMYDLLIFICVVYNMIFFIYCWNRIRQMGGAKSPSARALREACFRMIYYPLVQSFCWVFIWSRYFSSASSDEADPREFVPLLLDTLSSPLFGFGMFVVFLIQQPKAKGAMLHMLLPRCVRQYILKADSETTMPSESQASSLNYAVDGGSRRNTHANQDDSGRDTMDSSVEQSGSDSLYDDDGIIQIRHDEDSDSMYSNGSVSMVSRPSQLSSQFNPRGSSEAILINAIGGSNSINSNSYNNSNFNSYNINSNSSNNSSIVGSVSSVHNISSGDNSASHPTLTSEANEANTTQNPITASVAHTAPRSAAMPITRTNSLPVDGSGSQSSSPVKSSIQQNNSSTRSYSTAQYATSPPTRSLSNFIGLPSHIFGNSVGSPHSHRTNSLRSPPLYPPGTTPLTASSIQQQSSNESSRTTSRSYSQSQSRSHSKAISVGTNFSLLDEMDLFRVLQDPGAFDRESEVNGNNTGANAI